ncbi:MAG: tRNA-2-methylthio-N6-dimethylallyladenosine synthase [Candidatus Marinamargulisbacteria bacterium]|jgi:tRNA-2-methylthio-N6-dimethylallyladenosine synthase
MKNGKNVFIETYGCQMNEYDTELIKTILKKDDFAIVGNENEADVIMLNTCSIRENANRKIYNRVHTIRAGRETPVLVGVLGCMATNFKTDLLENKGLKIDFIAGPDSYKELPNLINAVSQTGTKQFDVTLSEFETYEDVYPTRDGGINAWISVMRGCNNFCTFCVVPFTRGRERSRDPKSVVAEVKKLVAEGFKQVTLLGQNVNSYRHDDYDFADLMAMVSDVPGVERIRYTSPHPKDFPDKFLSVMAERENICKQMHLPLQAGNSRILKKMNRTYTKQDFLDLVLKIRGVMPDIALSTDVIVGFPTETAEDFRDTMDIMEAVQFDAGFMFKYSERPNTTAARNFPDDVTEEDKKTRIIEIVERQKEISLAKNSAHIGKIQRILVENPTGKKHPENVIGRNDANTIVTFQDHSYVQGDFLDIKIVGASPHVLRGKVL